MERLIRVLLTAVAGSIPVLLAVTLAAGGGVGAYAASTAPVVTIANKEKSMTVQPYIGMWITADGKVRQELLSSGRYDEARGDRQSAYQGRYEIVGNHIEYWDDTGFTADGTFVTDNELRHGGMVFFREQMARP